MSERAVSIGNFAFLSRSSFSGASKRVSHMSLILPESEHQSSSKFHNTDDRNWSVSYLREKFRINGTERLYARYVQRLQHSFFNIYVLAQAFFSLAYAGLLVGISVDYSDLKNEEIDGCRENKGKTCIAESVFSLAIPEIICQGIIIFISLIILAIVSTRDLFQKHPWTQVVASGVICLLLFGTEIGLSFHFFTHYDLRRTPSAFQVLVAVYYFLPLSQKQSIIFGTCLSFLFLVFNGVLTLYNQDDDRSAYLQIAAQFVYYACVNFVGHYSQQLSEITVRRAFIDRRHYINNTIKKNYEKDREDNLLQSILPKHISLQVKDEIRQQIKLSEQLSRREGSNSSQSNNYSFSASRRSSSAGTTGRNSGQNSHRPSLQRKPFSDLFVERHDNVTILYADIVNFTPLTEKLKAEELVTILNELFGQFDAAAIAHDCLRIKLLGDCYYCVSGLPNPTPNHAKNCVELGYEMIDIINEIRESQNIDINMRIGIHSGNILSGILGKYKWQYDIWSKDVTIANHMESSGKAGHIHISKQTKDILGDAYEYKVDHGERRDKYLLENGITTFLVTKSRSSSSDNEVENIKRKSELDAKITNGAVNNNNNNNNSKSLFSRSPNTSNFVSKSRNSIAVHKSAGTLIKRKSMKVNSSTSTTDRRNYASGNDLLLYQEMLAKVNEKLEKAIDEMPISIRDRWCRRKSLLNTFIGFSSVNPFTLLFDTCKNEMDFHRQPDPLFKMYIALSFLVVICIGTIQGLMRQSQDRTVFWVMFNIVLNFHLILMPFSWVAYIWSRVKDPHQEMDKIPESQSAIVRYLSRSSNAVTNNYKLRFFLFIVISVSISLFAIIDVDQCSDENYSNDCRTPWYFTFSCALAILVIYAFFRIWYVLKLFIVILSLTGYSFAIFYYRRNVFSSHNGVSPALSIVGGELYSHIIYLATSTFLLLIMDRQMEYITRLDFIWKIELTAEHMEASITHTVNSTLIKNILPAKIAKIYLDPNRVGESHSRTYQNVSVMFASIPNFMDFYSENDFNKHGITCLQVLNEIITEFDEAIFDHPDVEKIKVIGSTYMAACGLGVRETRSLSVSSVALNMGIEPDNDNSEYSSSYGTNEFYGNQGWSDRNHNPRENIAKRTNTLLTLVKFAGDMMVRLNDVNRDSFQEFRLRVGLATGMVVAGVVGAQKPYFDIFGDTVNLASRMDSTGVPGRIQLSDYCAKLLKDVGCNCEYRDSIFVKGKGFMDTYFVKLNDKYEIDTEEELTPL